MADEDKEKAEKLAAAKKKYEQIKKQKQKEGKKAGTKKTTEKSVEDKIQDQAADVEEQGDVAVEEDDGTATAAQLKERASSFAAPHEEVQELYKKQTARIEELEKENKALKQSSEDTTARLTRTEQELEQLREGNSEVAALRSKAKEADTLSTELVAVQRQLSQAQQSAKGHARKMTATSPDLTQQLESKTSTIETLELEVSNLRNQISTLNGTIAERDDALKDAEERVASADAATQAAKAEIDALKVSIAFPSDETKAASEDPEALTKRITVLESDLRTATSDIEAASQKATTLQQKLDALTKLHRDVITASQTKERELVDLRAQIKRRDRPSHVRDASEFDLQDEETETGQLQARIRALEAENFDLKRGAWREQRGDINAEQDGLLEDVDLTTPYSARGSSLGRPGHSSFQDVINSGISAFFDDPRKDGGARPRKQSLGLLSEDSFDEEAFRLAQEEESKRRIERIKDVKRALPQWKGWRLDLVELRQTAAIAGIGPVFEV